MIEKTSTDVGAGDGAQAQQEEAGIPGPLPFPFPFPRPFPLTVSGLYDHSPVISPLPIPLPRPIPIPLPEPLPGPFPIPGPFPGPGPIPGPFPGPRVEESQQEIDFDVLPPFPLFRKEELRLDVDGLYPQMVASGVVNQRFARVNWIANVVAAGPNRYTGTISYKEGAASSFPYTNVDITVTPSWIPANRQAMVQFTGGGLTRTRVYKFKSNYFHDVDFEFDAAAGESSTTTVNTCAHPNRPATLPCETLSIENVFKRAGFSVTTSPGGTVPMTGAGADTKWSDMEMHDAMQVYWSRFSATSQWAMWVFFASLHETGTSLGGVMFDDIGSNHRQGTAIFNDAFISVPPGGDANPAAWVQRMIFWTACHEMGHAFNLAHSWQKSLGTPWIPGLADEPEARSFMNYPFRVAGGQSAFFANFEYRFSDPELLFMRHAPARFVQMGNADWFDHHGFQQANVSPEPTLQLELRVNRTKEIFEFMEPVTVELKLTNLSSQPELLDQNALKSLDSMTVIIKKDGKSARQFLPFAHYCYLPEKRTLLPGQSVYEPLFLSAGKTGWNLAEPGLYTIQVALERDGEDFVSNPLRIRIAPPRGYDEEFIGQDFFTDDVGRILAFDGSEVLTQGRETLAQVTERLGDKRVALHAALALGTAASKSYKTLVEDPQSPVGVSIKARKPQADEARELLEHALIRNGDTGAESFGHIVYKRYVDRFSDWLAEQGDPDAAAETQDVLRDTLATREVHGRKILGRVLDDVEAKRDGYRAKAKGRKTTRSKK